MVRRLVWGVSGLLCYLGAAVTLAMAVSPLLEGHGLSDLDMMTIGLLVVSAMLFALGGICVRRMAGIAPPWGGSQETASRPMSGVSSETGAITCPHCGTTNEGSFKYCSGCAQEL